jgi:hypothetical protein
MTRVFSKFVDLHQLTSFDVILLKFSLKKDLLTTTN